MLSNWDMLAVSLDGPCDGVFESGEVTLRIHKNFLYIGDALAWHPGAGFLTPTVAEVMQGEFRYKRLQIVARRGPQEGVFVIVRDDRRVMAGCGVYGYTDAGTWLVTEKSREFLCKLIDENLPAETGAVLLRHLGSGVTI